MRRFRTLKIPPNCPPIIRRLTEEQNFQRLGDRDLAERTGLAPETFKQWRARKAPTFPNLEAAFNALGFTLTRPTYIYNKDQDP